MKTCIFVFLIFTCVFPNSGFSSDKGETSQAVKTLEKQRQSMEIRGDRKLTAQEEEVLTETLSRLRKSEDESEVLGCLKTLGKEIAHNSTLQVFRNFIANTEKSIRLRMAAVTYSGFVISKESIDLLVEITQLENRDLAVRANYQMMLLGIMDCTKGFDMKSDVGLQGLQECTRETWDKMRESYEFPSNARYRVMQRL